MPVRRIVFCDEEGCTSSFIGTLTEQYLAHWRRVGIGRKYHRCPSCRQAIGTRPHRQPAMTPGRLQAALRGLRR